MKTQRDTTSNSLAAPCGQARCGARPAPRTGRRVRAALTFLGSYLLLASPCLAQSGDTPGSSPASAGLLVHYMTSGALALLAFVGLLRAGRDSSSPDLRLAVSAAALLAAQFCWAWVSNQPGALPACLGLALLGMRGLAASLPRLSDDHAPNSAMHQHGQWAIIAGIALCALLPGKAALTLMAMLALFEGWSIAKRLAHPLDPPGPHAWTYFIALGWLGSGAILLCLATWHTTGLAGPADTLASLTLAPTLLGCALSLTLMRRLCELEERATDKREQKRALAMEASSRKELANRVRDTSLTLKRKGSFLTALLEHAGDGFVLLDKQGRMMVDQSARITEWFGEARRLEPFAEFLERSDTLAADWFDLGWDMIVEGMLPMSVCIEQLPPRMKRDGRGYDIHYRPIEHDGKFVNLLVVITDVTNQLERERAEASEREFAHIFHHLSQSRETLLEYVQETSELVEHLAGGSSSPEQFKRDIHTIKGSSSYFGIDSMTIVCRDIEDEMQGTDEIDTLLMDRLLSAWLEVHAKVAGLIDTTHDGCVHVERDDLRRIKRKAEEIAPRSSLGAELERLLLMPLESQFKTLHSHALQVCEVLEKPPVRVRIVHNDIFLPSLRWRSFWSACIHVVRNAVDHGIEDAEQRKSQGKSPEGHLTLHGEIQDTSYVIEFQDDGAGIDWDKLSQRGKRLGLPHTSQSELEDLLFTDGLSTQESHNDVSGRGIGMAAVRIQCRALGGHVKIRSVPGKGTCFAFFVPVEGNSRDDDDKSLRLVG